MKSLLFLPLIAGLFLSGCANEIVGRSTGRIFKTTIATASEEIALDVSPENRARFRTQLNEELYSRGAFNPGNGLRIRYRFSEFENGSRALRYFIGYGAGKGRVLVHATYLDPAGHELATVEAEGSVTGGGFGGSKDDAFHDCAEQIVDYAKAHFLVGH